MLQTFYGRADRLLLNAKIICVRRSEEETAKSFLDWINSSRRPAASSSPESNWRAEETDLAPLSPPHDPALHEQRINQFWTTYQESTEGLAAQFPNNVRLIDALSSANTPLSIPQLLAWLGMPDKDILSAK